MQPTRSESVLDRPSLEAKRHELPAADDAMLTLCDAGDRPLVRSFLGVSYFRPRISWSM
jgi:hypothetical protein